MTNAGRELAEVRWAHTPVRIIACVVCGAPRQVKEPTARYCSNACRSRAYRARKQGLA